jgi:hypothetical protein
MAQRSKATAEKRRKEVQRIERQKQKAERRAQRKPGEPGSFEFASPEDLLMPLPPPPPDDPLEQNG